MWTKNKPNPSVPRPLKVAEVPEPLRQLYDFAGQKTRLNGQGKHVSIVRRRCLSCGNHQWTRVWWVRDAVRRGKLTGNCAACHARRPKKNPTGKGAWNWKGGRRVAEGYVVVLCKNHPSGVRYVMEHRLVMEKHIGRFLSRSETVHHKDGNKKNNRIDNLELWNRNHGDGARYDDMSVQALETLIAELHRIIESKRSAAQSASVD